MELFELFGRVNATVWPVLVGWHLLAFAAVVLGTWPNRRSSRLIGAGLAIYYAWVAVVFDWLNYSQINDHAAWYAAWFLLGAVLFAVAGVLRSDLVFQARRDISSIVGGLFIGYALVVYPIWGRSAGTATPPRRCSASRPARA